MRPQKIANPLNNQRRTYMVRIRLRREGKKGQPSYRIVAADREAPRDGRFLEILGHYNPRTNPSTIFVKEDRVYDWISRGAQPSDSVWQIFRQSGTDERIKRFKAGEDVETLLAEAEAARVEVDPRTRRYEAAPAKPAKPAPAAPKAEPKAEPVKPEALAEEMEAVEPEVEPEMEAKAEAPAEETEAAEPEAGSEMEAKAEAPAEEAEAAETGAGMEAEAAPEMELDQVVAEVEEEEEDTDTEEESGDTEEETEAESESEDDEAEAKEA
jgi:small subunit ribosomal protein S16